jgi:hypothetical protein|tara:strand:- start:133 stop:540 length:408 start_codon:yes stop_codon:yes gene_type:complete
MSDETKSKFVRYIPNKKYDIQETEVLEERTKIISEIAVRLLELRDIEISIPPKFLAMLIRLYKINPQVMWTCIRVLAGNSTSGVSLSEVASTEACSKQNIHQTQHRNLLSLEEYLPEIARTLRAILGRKDDTPSE